ncbi:MAG TPA: chitobiase/beta-hexosaminidase C-terminal domain-containing protein [Steroidobacteraceae bacterium]|nr:chitobiase/beta-hexosaminidase C-terminal domain-containing protein [Steroidobacteraceae bacterium]
MWVRSSGSAASYEAYRSTDVFTVADVLQAPVATPGAGTYTPAQSISLSSQAGADIRYTLDGTDPMASSTLYAGPLQLPVGSALLKARAYKTGWGESPVASWTYQIRTEVTPPTITAQLSPAPNAAGWNSTVVQVSFTCTDEDSGIASCTSPITLSSDSAAKAVTGEALDNAGNRATTIVVVNVDRSAPVVTVHAPKQGDLSPVGTTEVVIRGNVADFTSGVVSVTCGGINATLEGQRYTCIVPVSTGENTIQVHAADTAGNSTAKDVMVPVGEQPPPTSLHLTPSKSTLLPGEARPLRVTDERGQSITGGTLAIGDPTIAQVEILDNVPYIRGLAGGDTTLTLTREALTAQAEITVLPIGTTSYPDGTVIWELGSTYSPPPQVALRLRGRVMAAVSTSTPDGPEPTGLFFAEHGGFGQPTRVTGTSWDGRALWTYSGNEEVTHFAADNRGGVVLVVGGTLESSTAELPGKGWLYPLQGIRRLDGGSGTVAWEYLMGNGELSSVAIHPDGTVYVVETLEKTANLVALDGDTGAIRASLPLKAVQGTADYVNATAPVVRDDGSVMVLGHRWKSLWEYDNPQTILYTVNSETLALTEQSIDTAELSAVARNALQYDDVNRLLPDGQGGLLVLLSDKGFIYRVRPNLTLSNPLDLRPDPFDQYPQLAPQIVVGQNEAYALVQSWPFENEPILPRLVRFDPETLTRLSTIVLNQQVEQYLLHSISVGGSAILTGPEWGNSQQVAPGWWPRVQPAPALIAQAPVDVADTEAPYWAGNGLGQYAPPRPRFVHFVEPDALREGGPPFYTGFDFQLNVLDLKLKVVTDFHLGQHATVSNFLSVVSKTGNVVAFIGHSVLAPPEVGGGSVGLQFRGRYLVKRMEPQVYGAGDPALNEVVDKVESRAKIIFIAACELGERFKSLWGIDENVTDRALIVPQGAGTQADLVHSSGAWLRIAEALANGKTASEAVVAANAFLQSQGWVLRFQVVGGGGVKAH